MLKTILITGASTGFGRIAADILHDKGHKIYGTSRNPAKHNCDFQLLKLDTCDGDSISSAVHHVLEVEGKIDVLINNAGRAMYGAIEEASEQNIIELFETNVFGLMKVTSEVLPAMRKQKSGRIINVTSLAGITPTPSLGIYSATKHAVEGYSKCLKFELEQFGIDVLLVKPGEFMTQVFANSIKPDNKIDDYKKFRDLIQSQMDNRTPDNVLEPSAVGALIANLVDEENPKLDNLIGPYSDLFPDILTQPEQLYEAVRGAYQLHSLVP